MISNIVSAFLFLQLDKLKRSYHKLQRKHLKDANAGVKETDLQKVNPDITPVMPLDCCRPLGM